MRRALILAPPLFLVGCATASRTVFDYDPVAVEQSSQLATIAWVAFLVCVTVWVVAFVIAGYLKDRPRR